MLFFLRVLGELSGKDPLTQPFRLIPRFLLPIPPLDPGSSLPTPTMPPEHMVLHLCVSFFSCCLSLLVSMKYQLSD